VTATPTPMASAEAMRYGCVESWRLRVEATVGRYVYFSVGYRRGLMADGCLNLEENQEGSDPANRGPLLPSAKPSIQKF
jgi:hypothetical protein